MISTGIYKANQVKKSWNNALPLGLSLADAVLVAQMTDRDTITARVQWSSNIAIYSTHK